MKKINKKTIISLIIILLSFYPLTLLADENTPTNPKYNLKGAQTFMETVGGNIGYDTATTKEILIGNIIQIALSLLGIFFLVLIIIGGYQWMTAGGNEETITKARKRIINATIGLVVVLMAYAVSYFIIYELSVLTI